MSRPRAFLTLATAMVRLHWIALCVIAGLLLIYTLAGFFLVPYIARTQVTSYVTQTLHRHIALGDIRFNPYTLQAQIRDFELTEVDGSPLIAFSYLRVNAGLASLWQRAINLQEVQLDAPDVQLVIGKDGAVNLAQLKAKESEPPVDDSQTPMRVRIGMFAVTDGRIGLEDRSRAQSFSATVTPIRFTLNDFRTDAGYENAYQFAGTTQAGEQLDWSGNFTVQPLGSTGKFHVGGLQAATIDSYAYESIPFRLANGNLTLDGEYRFALEPFALDIALPAIAIRDLQLAPRNSKTGGPIVVPAIDVLGTTFSYAKRGVEIDRVNVNQARIDVARERDGSISLEKLFNTSTASASERQAGMEPPPPQLQTAGEDKDRSGAAAPWSINVKTINVAQASIAAEDRTMEPAVKFALTPVDLNITGFDSGPGANLGIDLAMTLNDKAKLVANGQLQLEPVRATFKLDLAGLELPIMQPYLKDVAAMTVHSGVLGIKGDVAYDASVAGKARFAGDVRVANLRTTDQLIRQDLIKWRDLAVSGIDVGLSPDHLTIDRIVARQLFAAVVIGNDRTLNVSRVLGVKQDGDTGTVPAAKSTTAPPAAKAFPVRVKRVEIIDSAANFADYSIEPSFAAGILGLKGTITGLSSDPASRAKVQLNGSVDKYAPVDIHGEVNLLSVAKYTDLALNFRNMELTTFNPYSGKFAGYNISKGKLSTELRYQVADRMLNASHHIVLDNLEFGAKTDSKDAAPIPLKLAIALLKDRNGVIDVNLPVTGTLDDPKFRLGPIVWKAVLGLLTKIVTAPFAALGALFGGGEELAFVDFPAGSAALPLSQIDKLNTLAKALIERPQLRLAVPLLAPAQLDSDALTSVALASRLPDADEPAVDDAGRRRQLSSMEKLYRELAGAAPVYPPETGSGKTADVNAQLDFLRPEVMHKLRPGADTLAALAQQRSRAVQDALLGNTALNAERVFITAERTEAAIDAGTVRMEMKLE